MLSLTRTKLALVAHALFLGTSSAGLLLGAVYNARTPDLYPRNVHHPLGWLISVLALAHAAAAVVRAFAPRRPSFLRGHTSPRARGQPSPPPSYGAETGSAPPYRYSRDSGQGTEPDSPRTVSPAASPTGVDRVAGADDEYRLAGRNEERFRDPGAENHEEVNEEESDDDGPDGVDNEKAGLLGSAAVDRFLRRRMSVISSGSFVRGLNVVAAIIDRTILVFGFVALATGLATYGGFFVRPLSPVRIRRGPDD